MGRGITIGFNQGPLLHKLDRILMPIALAPMSLMAGTPVSPPALTHNLDTVRMGLTVENLEFSTLQTKWNPGHYMASNTPNNTGSNGPDFSALAAAPNVLGWMGFYRWGTVTSTQGVYDFSNLIADWNAEQVAAPGKRFAATISLATFHPSAPITQTISSGWLPAYILNGSAYGPGSNGTQFGYSQENWDGVSGFEATTAAVWRPAVATEYSNMLAAWAATSVTLTAGPWAGQTYTVDTHPGYEATYPGFESALNFTNVTNDYSDAALRTQLAAIYQAARAAFPHTLIRLGLNFCATYANMPGFVADLHAKKVGLGGPDLITQASFSWAQHLLRGDTTSNNGSSWTNGGGPSYLGEVDSGPWVQQPDYAKATNTTTIAQAGAALNASHIFWTRLSLGSGAKGDWTTDVLPVINANPITFTARPTDWPAFPALTITNTTPLNWKAATQGALFIPLTTIGGTGSSTWAFTSSTGSSTWVLAGPPGSQWVEMRPTVSETTVGTFSLTDASGNPPITVKITVVISVGLQLTNIQQLPQPTQGAKYYHNMSTVAGEGVSGGTAPYTWAAPANVIPGLTLSSAGVWTGTASAQGTYSVPLTATDKTGLPISQTVQVIVRAPSVGTRPAYNTGTGFYVVGGKLFDTTNQEFRIRGVNRTHYDSSGQFANSPANAVRLFLNQSASGSTNVGLCTSAIAAKMVIIPTFNGPNGDNSTSGGQTIAGNASTEGSVQGAASAWVTQFPSFSAIQGSMIPNIANEWGPSNSSGWASAYTQATVGAVTQMRAAGYTCPLMIDSGGFGQDINDLLNFSTTVFNADPQKNIVFSFHLYGNTTLAQMPGYFNSLATLSAAQGMVFVIGEFGPGRNISPSPTTIQPSQVILAAEAADLGWMPWAWDDNNAGGGTSTDSSFSFTYAGPGVYSKPSDLTLYGFDCTLNPKWGLKALATPASSFL